ncbi:MAG: pilus assembly protein TadG-related protein [Acidimicrobiia bacterium]
MRERGSITLWMVGMVMVVFVVGGIAIDLWRGLAAHRQVAAVVDSAAVAAGSGIDEIAWRDQGLLRLDAGHVDERVAVSVSAQDPESIVVAVVTAADGSSATVTGSTTVDLTLLAIVADGAFEVSATATASPILSP